MISNQNSFPNELKLSKSFSFSNQITVRANVSFIANSQNCQSLTLVHFYTCSSAVTVHHTSVQVCHQIKQESPAVADKPARRLRKVCTVYVRAVGCKLYIACLSIACLLCPITSYMVTNCVCKMCRFGDTRLLKLMCP